MKKYKIIYADPPWSYSDTRGGGAGYGGISYPTMTQKEIELLPVNNLADQDCMLFLWATIT